MIKENISVTGGAGFVGSTLVDELIREGHRVSVIDSLITGKRDYINPQADFFEVDICSDKINKIFKEGGFNIVFHLAAQIDPRYSVEHPEIDNQVNVFGGLNILRN
ncbi:MAG: UDP-glucose 4-epimerase, partial [Candidatus Daviesbacteria bacterium GW2011_GWB1_41_5]